MGKHKKPKGKSKASDKLRTKIESEYIEYLGLERELLSKTVALSYLLGLSVI